MVSLKDSARIVIIFIMVAPPLVFGAGEDDDKKQWSSVQKLIGSNNFILWYSGLSVALMGMTSHKWKNAREVMVYLYQNPEKTFGQVRNALKLNSEDMEEAALHLFLAIFQTIDNKKAQLKILLNTTYSGKGVEAFQYLWKKFGSSGVKQSETHFNLLEERQRDGETPQDFAERLSNINATLSDQVSDTILVNIFLKGLWDSGLKTYMLQRTLPADIEDAANLCDSYETQERILNEQPAQYRAFIAQDGRGKGKGKGKGIGMKGKGLGMKGKGGRGGNGREGAGRGYGNRNQKCDVCGLDTHFWRACWALLPHLRPDWMDENAHREYDQWCVDCLNRTTPDKRQMFLAYRREKNEPELAGVNGAQVNANLAEVAQQGAAQDFPGLVARTHLQPSGDSTLEHAVELIVLGLSTFAYICSQAKHGLYCFLVGPIMRIAFCLIALVSCMGGCVLFTSMMAVQFGRASGALTTPYHISPSSFKDVMPVIATPESSACPAFPAGCSMNPLCSLHYDSCAGMWMFPTMHNLVKADAKPVRAEVSSCFGNRAPSKLSGIFRVGIRHNRQDYIFDVHGLYVPALPQALASATSFMKSHNVSLVLSRAYPHIVLPNGTKVPLDTKDDVALLHDVFYPSISSGSSVPPHQGLPSYSRWSAFNAAITSQPKGSAEKFKRWTQRCAGLAPVALSHMASNAVGCDCPSEVPSDCKNLTWYASGLAGKMRASSHKHTSKRATRFREVVQFDYLEFTIHGMKFHSLNFVDTFTTHAKAYVTKSRSEADMMVLRYVNETDPYVDGTTTFECQHDQAKEFLSKSLQKKADLSGIVMVTSVPYQHEMNGSVERFNQTLQRMVITLLDDSKLPMEYVKYVIRQAEWIYNRVPVADLEWKSRYEMVSERKPDVRTLYRIGCLARRLVPLEKRTHKFHTRVEDCVNLGWNGSGWDLLRLSDNQVLQDVDVVMYEHEMPLHARSVGGGDNVVTGRSVDAPTVEGQDLSSTSVTQPSTQSSTASTKGLPPGWSKVIRQAKSKSYPIYFGPAGQKCYSFAQVCRIENEWNDLHHDADVEELVVSDPPVGPALPPLATPVTHRNPTTFTPDSQAYVPYNPAPTPDPGQRVTRSSGVVLPQVNVMTGDTVPSVVQQLGDGSEVFVATDPGVVPANLSRTHAHHATRSSRRIPWGKALLAFAASLSPARGVTASLVHLGDMSMNYVACIDCFSASASMFDMGLPEPFGIKEAQSSPNWDAPKGYKWSTEVELGRWKDMGAYKSVMSIPDRVKSLGLRFVYTVKTDDHGNFKHAKCRLVVLGHKSIWGEHFLENCATTVKWPSFRVMIQSAVSLGCTIVKQWDTSTAFLYADLEANTEVYVQLPPELATYLGETSPYWKILKSCYGLPSAPREFQRHVMRTMKSCKMSPTKTDTNVYVRWEGAEFIFICTWVDDFCVLSNSQRLYDDVKSIYFSTYKCSEEDCHFMLGAHLDVDLAKGQIKIHSQKQISRMLQKFGTPSRTSLVPATQDFAKFDEEEYSSRDTEPELFEERRARYRSLVPSLLYLATTTRPDVAYAVGTLCRFMESPSEAHLRGAETVLSYLAKTSTHGIVFQKDKSLELSARYSPLKDGLLGLSDSSWSTGKSISGYVLLLAGVAVVWACKRQPVTSLSSTEAEYYAASSCGAEILYVRHLLHDLGCPQHSPTPLLVDNSACVSLGKDPGTCKRARHIDRRIHFLSDYQEMGDLQLYFISTKDNVADVFTKPLEKITFSKHRNVLVTA